MIRCGAIPSFSKIRDRLLEGKTAVKFLAAVLLQPRVKWLLSSEHFSVDGTLIQTPGPAPLVITCTRKGSKMYLRHLLLIILLMLLIFVISRSFNVKIVDVNKYGFADTLVNIGLGIGNMCFGIVTIGLVYFTFSHAYYWKICTYFDGFGGYLALFLLEDLCYYLFHRASHSVRLLWCSHSVHHSSRYFNLSVALREPWTGRLTGQFLFWLPLPLLGFPIEWIEWQGCVSMAYQTWLHSETASGFPRWLEAVLNTPGHHKIHHAHDPMYHNKNFGGILIIWDRLLGTFSAPLRGETTTQFGLVGQRQSDNLFVVAFNEWANLIRDIITTKSFDARVLAILGKPGKHLIRDA